MKIQIELRINLFSLDVFFFSIRLNKCQLIVFFENEKNIRVLSSLFILQNITKKIRFIHDLNDEFLFCDYFDIICDINIEEYFL